MLQFNARKAMAATGIVAASIALSGCQALFGPSFASRGEAQNVDMADYFEGRLAMGRLYLEKGLTTQAIIAFRQASYDPRFAGEAFNGMAIAYDQLGRGDLAHRYFNMAVAAAPQDDRFSRNLARLESRVPVMPDAMPQVQPVELAQLDLPEMSEEPAPPAARKAGVDYHRRQAGERYRGRKQAGELSRPHVPLGSARKPCCCGLPRTAGTDCRQSACPQRGARRHRTRAA